MVKRLKYYILFIIVIVIICAGILQVTNSMPEFIKDRSSVRVTYSVQPFNFRMETKNYLITLSSKEIMGYIHEAENKAESFSNMMWGFCNNIKNDIVKTYNKLIDII